MLREQIQNDMKQAMKARDAESLETLRYIWSEIKNKEIDTKEELDDVAVEQILRTEVKRRRDAMEQFTTGNREDLVAEELKRVTLIESYLPQQMSEQEIGQVVDEVMAGGGTDFGIIMGQVMGRVKGKADGKLVSEVVKKKMS